MKKGERRRESRHAAVVAADMQPCPGAAFGEERADRRGVVPLWRPEQCHGTRMLGQCSGELDKIGHVGRGV